MDLFWMTDLSPPCGFSWSWRSTLPGSPHSLQSSTTPAGGCGLTWEAVEEIGVQHKQEEKVLPDS